MDFAALFSREMDAVYLISQIFALIATILSLYAYQKRKKADILNYTAIAAFCSALHYLFLGAWPGVVNKSVGTARNAYAAYEAHKHRASKIAPCIFVVFYIVVGFFTYDSPASLLPIVASCLDTVVIYFGNAKWIRYIGALTAGLWLVYNIFVLSIVGIATEAIFILNDGLAIYRYGKREQQKSNKNKSAKKHTKKTKRQSKSIKTRQKIK